MQKWTAWTCSLFLALMCVAPLMAGTKDGTDAKSTADISSSSAAEAANTTTNSMAGAPAATNTNVPALLGILVLKGVLSPDEAKVIRNATPEAEMQLLAQALSKKGILSPADLSAAIGSPATGNISAGPTEGEPGVSTSLHSPAVLEVSTSAGQAATKPAPESKPATPKGPSVVPAIPPVRLVPVDPPVKDGLKAAIKLGAVKMTPYGFLKATGVYDTSSPNGDDFPFPGIFLNNTSFAFTTGPTLDPEFHVKARQARVGANFEWPDISPKLVFTGRIEADYEGNFSEVDNRDVSSIRSPAMQLRLAYARMDYVASDKTDIYFEGGQDWTLFGSSVTANLLETTFFGAYWGVIWERSPQFQFGMVQKLGSSRNFKISPTFAIMMPTSSQIEKLGSLGLAAQIAQAEREGADSGRPELEARLALQFQLDKAPGVASAQLLVAGFHARRTSIVPNSAPGYSAMPANYIAAFPNGFEASSDLYGGQIGIQLPTRYFTIVASAYKGGDLRFFFGGQINSFATDTSGLTNIQSGPSGAGFATLDGGPLAAAGGAVLGTNAAGQVVVAPQKPIRSFGGFVNIGFPLSRWFKANPEGHNAGWQLYLTAGKDQVNNHDLNNSAHFTANANILAPLPLAMGKMFAATLFYKVNPWCTFGYEQSVYGTRFMDRLPGYTLAGVPSNEWQDHRSEFGPIFTF
jgi:hypothetical protein